MPCQGKLTPTLNIRAPRGDVGPQAQSICQGSVESSCRSSRTEILLYANFRCHRQITLGHAVYERLQ